MYSNVSVYLPLVPSSNASVKIGKQVKSNKD
jgi:hypothetical protein